MHDYTSALTVLLKKRQRPEGDRISFQAQCQFNETPLTGDYPFLVGMQVNGSATSVRATLVQILIEGYDD